MTVRHFSAMAAVFVLIAGTARGAGQLEEVRPGWDARVEQWGTLREVLGDGKTEARVNLAEVTAKPNAYAVGALAGLEGEILVLNGEVMVSRASTPRDSATDLVEAKNVDAALLTAAHVAGWRDVEVERDVPAAEVDDYIAERIRNAGFDESAVVPFVIQGDFTGIQMHIVNKVCPTRVAPADDTTYRKVMLSRRGTLLGFFAAEGAGIYTHHNSKTHMHFIASEPKIMGHVESIGIKRRSVLRLPQK